MGIIALLLKLLFSAALFWIAMVFVTKDNSWEWKECILWVAIAMLIQVVMNLLTIGSASSTVKTVVTILAILISYGFLYMILSVRYQIYDVGSRVKILGIYFLGRVLLNFAGC